MGARRARRLPTLSQQPRPPLHLCGAGGCEGWIPIPILIPAVLAASPVPRVLGIPSQAGTGSAGREGEGSEEGGVLTPLGTPREGPGDIPT